MVTDGLAPLSSVVMPKAVREARARWLTLSPEERAAIESRHIERETVGQLRHRRQSARDRSGITGTMWEKTLLGYEGKSREQFEACVYAHDYVYRYPDVQQGLMFWGLTGVGKSHLARAIAVAVLEKPRIHSVRYVYCGDLGMILTAERRRYDVDEHTLYEQLLNTGLVVLDDVEKGWSGDAPAWSREMLKNLLDHIDRTGRPRTIATSEHGLDAHKAELRDSLIGRMRSAWNWIEVRGTDRRRV